VSCVLELFLSKSKKIFLTLIAVDFYSHHGSLDLMWISAGCCFPSRSQVRTYTKVLKQVALIEI